MRVAWERFGDDLVPIGTQGKEREDRDAQGKINDEVFNATIEGGKRIVFQGISDGTEWNAEENKEKITDCQTDNKKIRHCA